MNRTAVGNFLWDLRKPKETHIYEDGLSDYMVESWICPYPVNDRPYKMWGRVPPYRFVQSTLGPF